MPWDGAIVPASCFAALHSFFFGSEPLTASQLISLLPIKAGYGVIFWTHNIAFNARGILITLGSAIAYSIYIVCLSKRFGHISPKTTMTYTTTAAVVCFFASGLNADIINWRPQPAKRRRNETERSRERSAVLGLLQQFIGHRLFLH
ncbi:MAG: hypothetical protein ACOX8W_07605 [bacterium]